MDPTQSSAGDTGTSRYQAFISYSTAADGRLAPALQKGLQRFAKPWFRIRAMRVFRDQTGLGVTPALWNSIEKALHDSESFILLASPGAANSKWVDQEVEWWLRHRSANRLLVVLTEGDIAWDDTRQDFDWARTNAVPKRLSKAFTQEPYFLDLRWARNKAELSLRHPTFADAVARLVATLRGRPLDELIGEDIRQHRATVRVLAVASALIATVSAAALFAVYRSDRAWRLADRLATTEEDANRADRTRGLSHQLAVAAFSQLASDRELAILLARESVRLHRNPESESALRQSLSGDLQPVRMLSGRQERECYASFHSDGSRLLTWGESTARIFDAATGTQLLALRGHAGDVLDARFSADGTQIVTTGEDDSVRIWDANTGLERTRLHHPGAASSRIDAGGDRVLSLAPDGAAVLWDVASKTKLTEFPLAPVLPYKHEVVSWHPGTHRIAVCGPRGPVVFDARTGNVLGAWSDHSSSARSIDFHPDGELVVTAEPDSTARIWRVATGESERTLTHPGVMPNLQEARYSPDGRWIATRDQAHTVALWNAATGALVARIEPSVPAENPQRFLFSPNGSCLLTATFDASSVEVWEAATGRRLATLVGDEGEIRTLSFSPDARRVLVGSIFAPARLYDCDVCGPIDTLLTAAAQRVPRDFTSAERARYLPGTDRH